MSFVQTGKPTSISAQSSARVLMDLKMYPARSTRCSKAWSRRNLTMVVVKKKKRKNKHPSTCSDRLKCLQKPKTKKSSPRLVPPASQDSVQKVAMTWMRSSIGATKRKKRPS